MSTTEAEITKIHGEPWEFNPNGLAIWMIRVTYRNEWSEEERETTLGFDTKAEALALKQGDTIKV